MTSAHRQMYSSTKHITIYNHLFRHSFIITCLNSGAQRGVNKYVKFSKHIRIVQQLPHYPTKFTQLLLSISFLDADV